MTKIDTSRPETVLPTPSHTVGPFYGHALPFPGGGDIAPLGHPDTISLHGRILDLTADEVVAMLAQQASQIA